MFFEPYRNVKFMKKEKSKKASDLPLSLISKEELAPVSVPLPGAACPGAGDASRIFQRKVRQATG